MTSSNENSGILSKPPHPYLHGNFAPIHRICPLTPCTWVGEIPEELAGGQYVRNGGNPVTNEDLGRDAHWFDGDGMLSGVSFRRLDKGQLQPEFVNQYILTDVFLSSVTTTSLRTPILPSVATLVNPASTLLRIILSILRAVILVILSNLPGSQQVIKRMSVANTSILFHDGRALATCESGPPMRVQLPGLETVGWYEGTKAEGERPRDEAVEEAFGGDGIFSWMKEWTTAHPRVDAQTKELILFHSTFLQEPYVQYSIIPSTRHRLSKVRPPRLVNVGIPGIKSAKMMHDFGVSQTHTVIMDLPLSLDPRNLLRNQPVVSYDPSQPSRFGVFPRWQPSAVRWFETNPCCIFHTANTWDKSIVNPFTGQPETTAVNKLVCRLTSATLVYSAGDIAAPIPKPGPSIYENEDDQCRLYYYRFALSNPSSNIITHQFALSAIPFEFPSLKDEKVMSQARYIYGCSTTSGSFTAALGRAAKIDCLVKIDALSLISRAQQFPPKPITGCVDTRTISDILESPDPNDPIKIFRLPSNHYAQESRFVARNNPQNEDDGWILSYVFDESQLNESDNAMEDAKSELWIIDAKNMRDVVCKISLPQRVPYGLHGSWFSEEQVSGQREVEMFRRMPEKKEEFDSLIGSGWRMRSWLGIRRWILERLG